MRLARFTGRPNQSPALLSAGPRATPARSWGKSLPSASAASSRLRVASSSGSGSTEASIAASPIVLTSLTGSSTTSAPSASRRRARRPRPPLLSEPGEADQVGEADRHLTRSRQLPAATLSLADRLALGHLAQVHVEQPADQW